MTTIAPCGSRPNCVSSTATDAGHSIEPLSFTGDAGGAMDRLRSVMADLPRATLVSEEEAYLHYEVRSRLMRFVDDVEFGLNEDESVIDVRSAARVGYSDMGVNRKRVEEIRWRFDKSNKKKR